MPRRDLPADPADRFETLLSQKAPKDGPRPPSPATLTRRQAAVDAARDAMGLVLTEADVATVQACERTEALIGQRTSIVLEGAQACEAHRSEFRAELADQLRAEAARLKALRAEVKQRRIAMHELQDLTFERMFMKHAKRRLDPALYEELIAGTTLEVEEQRARLAGQASGAALPARGGGGGIRQRDGG